MVWVATTRCVPRALIKSQNSRVQRDVRAAASRVSSRHAHHVHTFP